MTEPRGDRATAHGGLPADPDLAEVLDVVLDVVRGLLPEPVSPWGPEQADVSLADLGFDSLRTVKLLVAVENAFDIELPQEQITADTFRTALTLAHAVDKTRHAHG
ncbi:phosphopantetheine-binding protein [Streptomyces sp. NPDC127190]|uniref:phosphopantetheine-binding protein n=1 Tax=unclassified Streptomyces TaxID=2593676 RepID=UPI003644D468